MAEKDTGTLIHQGTLIKSPPEKKSKDLGRWRKRYFKLWSTKKLEYYKNEKSDKPLKKPIDLDKCKSIDGDLKNRKWNNIFCVNTEYRKFYLVADSADCMKDWIKKLCDTCGFSEQVTMLPVEGSSNAVNTSAASLDSPSSQRNSPVDDTEASELGSSPPRRTPPLPSPILDELPSYEKELPPLPNCSSETEDMSEARAIDSPPPIVGSHFGNHVKQSKSNVYLDSPGSCYDMVPKPRLAVDELVKPSGIPKRRVSTPSESALKNMTINDESYVDMQSDYSSQDNATHNFVATLRPQASSYDIVPPPRPLIQGDMSNYDMVPAPRPKSDEYITCEINERNLVGEGKEKRETPPPVPDQTYTGFETLPDNRRVLQRSTRASDFGNEVYDVPPRHNSVGDIYDVPPAGDIYDVPPAGEIYDVPPAGDIYDVPPTGDIYNVPPIAESNLIYDTPPVKNEASTYAANSCGDSIYDTPPAFGTQDDALYDMPPSQNQVQTRTQDRGFVGDSLYDLPPQTSELTGRNDDSIYDIPPTNQSFGEQDDVYDTPPRTRTPETLESQTSPADLFNFGFNAPPKIDRSLKYASTGEIDTCRSIPPPVDRKTRPVLASSVPSFPSSIERAYATSTPPENDSIYDCPPRSADDELRNLQTQQDTRLRYAHESQIPTSLRPLDRATLHYSDFDFGGNSGETPAPSKTPSHYSSIDTRLTTAIQNVRP